MTEASQPSSSSTNDPHQGVAQEPAVTGSDILPYGMDVRDALAKCEDPALGWSLQFWVTIADPVTNHVFFACPATGSCSWEPPIGAFLLPRQADGEWWELADAKRGNRSYYYNTLTATTQWTRPSGNAFVIPLGLIQQAALPPRPAHLHTPTSRTSTPAHLIPNKRTTLAPPIDEYSPSRPGPRPPPSPRGPNGPTSSSPTVYDTSGQAGSKVQTSSVPVGNGNGNGSRGVLGTVDERSSQDSDEKAKLRSQFGESSRSPASDSSASPITPPDVVMSEGSLLRRGQPATVPIRIASIHTKRLSTGLHQLLPPDLNSQIQSLQSADSLQQYFATRRSGIRRTKLPVDKILEWQSSSISSPILVIPNHAKEAVVAFKVIQHAMADTNRAVDIPRMTKSSSANKLAQLAGLGGGHDRHTADKTAVLEEIRWMIQLAVTVKEMRDEVYCQLVKQLTKNPRPNSFVHGFQLFCVLVNAFCPSSTFEPLVRTFLQRHVEYSEGSVPIMAKYCIGKLDALFTQNSRARALTISEIEAASDAAFYPSVFGESLERIMAQQERAYPSLLIPVILPFLADGILALGGTTCEGIFRIPGDNDAVTDLKVRMDRGHYQLGIKDASVAASLFKLWLRDLESPIIPVDRYNACLAASSSVDESIDFVCQLPVLNRRVLLFVISFIQLFLRPDVVEVTKMTASNLALIMAPNLLRTTSDVLVTVFTNSAFESQFVLNLLLHMDPAGLDSEYTPTHGTIASE